VVELPVTKRKVLAYVTHGDRLLVFRHPHAPEAGIQVPGGSVNEGERLEEAVMREAYEETGLSDLVFVRRLGSHRRDMSDVGREEIIHRSVYHLRCDGDPPPTWEHYETDPSDGGPAPILFEFFWARLPDGVPRMVVEQDKLLPRLIELLRAEGVVRGTNPAIDARVGFDPYPRDRIGR
jgi:ADP-ribose pyrophosphatase YjhB (NUDIX family)